MDTNLRVDTTIVQREDYLKISAHGRYGDLHVAECNAELYPNGICDLLHFHVEPKYEVELVANATIVTRAVVERAEKEMHMEQYFCWGIFYPEWVTIFADVLPYNFYFTPHGAALTAEMAMQRRQRSRFVIWRGFVHEPQQPVSASLPLDTPHIERRLSDEIGKNLCEEERFSTMDITLLVKYFLARPLTERERDSLFVRSGFLGLQAGLLDRFERSAVYGSGRT